MTTGQLLEYSNEPRRRKRWRWVLLVCLLLTVSTVGYFWKPLRQRAELLYWQRECMNYTRPANSVLFSVDGNLRDPDYARDPTEPQIYFWLEPACFRKFLAASRVLPPARQGPGKGTVFLHERTSKSGNRRLVHVEVWGDVNALWMIPSYEWSVIKPASLFDGAKVVNPNLQRQYSGRFVAATSSFGQFDENDSSHFTIGYQIGKRSDIIDGWLLDDDTILLKLRDAATTRGL